MKLNWKICGAHRSNGDLCFSVAYSFPYGTHVEYVEHRMDYFSTDEQIAAALDAIGDKLLRALSEPDRSKRLEGMTSSSGGVTYVINVSSAVASNESVKAAVAEAEANAMKR